MSLPPPPPTWGSPPYGSPEPPPGGPPGMSNKAKFWIGVAIAVPVMIASGSVLGLAASMASSAGGGSDLSGAVAGLVALAMVVGFVTMLVLERTRWVALGMLAGGATALILAAGACLVLIASLSGSVGNVG